jgi:2-methylcitrate dehydratase PrpD
MARRGVPAFEEMALAEWVAEVESPAIPAGIRAHAVRIFQDTLGVILRGAEAPEVRRLAAAMPKVARGGATIFTQGFPRSDPFTAAWLNGTAGIFLELDEGHRPTGHPGIHVLPATLALAEWKGCSGREFLAACILGYEVAARISHATLLRPSVHPHGHMGAVGAAAACAKLLGLEATGIRHAMGQAATLGLATSWTPCFDGATVRNFYAGLAGAIGLRAALAARAGFTAPDRPLHETFGRLLGTRFDPGRLVEGLGKGYEIASNYVKFHACCACNHPGLDALDAILRDRAIAPETVARVIVETTPRFTIMDAPYRPIPLSAKFSLPYAVAARVVTGGTGVEAFEGAALRDPRIQRLSRRVVVRAGAEWGRRWPREAGATVTLFLTTGERLRASCANPLGSAPNPAPAGALRRKFLSLTAPILGAKAPAAWSALGRVTVMPAMAEVGRLLRRLAGRRAVRRRQPWG